MSGPCAGEQHHRLSCRSARRIRRTCRSVLAAEPLEPRTVLAAAFAVDGFSSSSPSAGSGSVGGIDIGDYLPEVNQPIFRSVVMAASSTSGAQATSLPTGMILQAGEALLSANGNYRVVMQGDGNLVLYAGSSPLWHTHTSGNPGAFAVLQGDGNLVIYSAANQPLRSTGTHGNPGSTIELGDDGNLVLHSASGDILWQSGTSQTPGPPTPPTPQGTVLRAGDSLTSTNGSFRIVMQGDGNLVLYAGSLPLWHTHTSGHPGAFAVLQGDGNLVIYSASNQPLRFTGTQGNPGATLQVGDDGNLLLLSASGGILWQTGTSQTPTPPTPPPTPPTPQGTVWRVGDSLTSGNGNYRMVMQGDGNLVLYAGSRPLWHTHTSGNPGAYAVLQGDGNLVIYSASSQPLRFTGTQGNPNATLVLDDDGNLVLRSASGGILWQTATSQTPAPPTPPTSQGTVWRAGDSLTSGNGVYRMAMQGDGNLVLYAGSQPLWHTQTSGNPGAYTVLQGDGNLVLYSASSQPLRFTGTQGNPGATLALGDDGNLVLRSASGGILWQTGTSQTPGSQAPAGSAIRTSLAIQAERLLKTAGDLLELQELNLANPSFDLSPAISALQYAASQIVLGLLPQLDAMLAGSVSTVDLGGGPLGSSDLRAIDAAILQAWQSSPQTSNQAFLETSSATVKSEEPGIETAVVSSPSSVAVANAADVDSALRWQQQLGRNWYAEMVNSTLDGIDQALGRVEAVTNTVMLGITAALETGVVYAKQNGGNLGDFTRTLDRLAAPVVNEVRLRAINQITQLEGYYARLVNGFFNSLIPQFRLSNATSVAKRMANQWNTFLRERPTPAWGAFQQGGPTPSDQSFSTPASAMNITFWMQPFQKADRFVVSDSSGRVYVDRNFSTVDFNENVPLQQQSPLGVNFTKPEGVTRLRVQVFPNADSSTGWWYRGVMQGQLWF